MTFSSVGIVGSGSRCRELVGHFARDGARVRLLPWGRGGPTVGLWTAPFRDQLQLCREPRALYGCDLVIEQIRGGLAEQLGALRRIEAALSRGAILAVSTERAPVDHIAQRLRRPEQAVGVAFAGSQVALSRTDWTAPGVHQAVRQALAALGLSPFEAVADAAE